MIILQILAGLLLLPLTLLMFIAFNIYCTNGGYVLLLGVFLGIYALLWSTLFAHTTSTFSIFIFLFCLYVIRMMYLAYIMPLHNYPFITGTIKSKYASYRTVFLIPLSFLNMLKWLPAYIQDAFYAHTKFRIPDLINLIFAHSKKTKFQLTHKEIDVSIEIH